MIKLLTISIFAVAFTLLGAPANADPVSDQIARIEGPQSPNRQGTDPLTLQQILERFKVPGISIAVIHDFKVEWTKSYGLADVETHAPITADTLFQAASMSKPVAAMASIGPVSAFSMWSA